MRLYTVLLTLLFIGCSNSIDTSAPTSVTSKFYNALIKNDIKSARQYILDKENLPDDGTTSFSIDKYKFSEIAINDNQAFITTSLVFKGKTSKHSTVLTKVNGKWKILIKKTMLNMIRNAIQEGDVSMKITDITFESK